MKSSTILEIILRVPKDIQWAAHPASCNHERGGLWKNAKLAKIETDRSEERETTSDHHQERHSFNGMDLGLSCDQAFSVLDFFAVYMRDLMEFRWDNHLVLYHALLPDKSGP